MLLRTSCCLGAYTVLLLLVILVPALALGPFDVVPTDYWAYGRVQELIKHGVKPAGPAFEFTASSTRFEYAKFLAATLKDRVFPPEQSASKGSARTTSVAEVDLHSLELLDDEFKDELTAIGVDLDAVKMDISEQLKPYQKKTVEGPWVTMRWLTVGPKMITPVFPYDAPWSDVSASGRLVGGGGEHCIGVEWDNPFYISKVVLRLPQGFRVFDSSKLRVRYWRLDRPVRSIDFALRGVNLAPAEQRCYVGEWGYAHIDTNFRLGGGEKSKGPPFDDVPTNHWAYRAIALLVDHGIMQGYSPGATRCKPAMTRFEFAQAFARAWLEVEKGIRPNTEEKKKVTLLQSDVEAMVELFDEFEDLLKQMDVDTTATRLQLAELWEPFGDREDVLSKEASPLDAWMLTFPCPQSASTGVKRIPCNLLTTKLQVIFPKVVPYGTEINVIGHSYPLQ